MITSNILIAATCSRTHVCDVEKGHTSNEGSEVIVIDFTQVG